MIKKYYDYKPIPKYKKGDMVYRCWCGIWKHHPEEISRVSVKEDKGKWYIEYYFYRERTPYNEEDLYPTLEDLLNAELQYTIDEAKSRVQFILKTAEKRDILLITPQIEFNEQKQ